VELKTPRFSTATGSNLYAEDRVEYFSVFLVAVISATVFVVLFQTEQSLELLVKFEKINACQLDVAAKYTKLLLSYGQDLEQVRLMYQSEKTSPTTSRNLPPIAGRIAWARQLLRRIEAPMKVFKTHPDILKVSQ